MTNSTHNTTKHIMLVEDDESLAEWITDYLITHGYTVTLSNRGDEAIRLVEIDNPDLLILDINLPVKDGFDICTAVRSFYKRPILILTARNEEMDEVLGLELGADDYLSKPVKPRLLLARIKALLRRGDDNASSAIREYGGLKINASSKSVMLDETPISLSTNEFDILWLLSSNSGKVLSRKELVNELRGIEYSVTDRSVDILISRLRKKLHDNAEKPYRIKTVWGKGYLFAEDAWN